MKNLVFLCFSFFFFIHYQPITAQPEGVKFGKIAKEELTMSTYDKDPDAVAVVLYDVGSTQFNYNTSKGFQYTFERKTRIKILRKEGYEYADVSVPYYVTNGARESVASIKASTYNFENGKEQESKMEKSAIFDDKADKHWHYSKFTLPNVREGSVIEYTYEITSDFIISIPEWEFQWDIPVAWSEYTVATPEYFRYVQISQGYNPFDVQDSDTKGRSVNFVYSYDASSDPRLVQKRTGSETVNYTDKILHWVQKDMPAYKDEPYSPAREDLIEKIEFQLASATFPGASMEQFMPNWNKLAAELMENDDFGKMIRKGNNVQDIIASVTNGLASEKEKINALQAYVKNNFLWNEYYGIYASQATNQLLKNRTGSSADLNLLLVLLLREAGIDAHPVILSTRNHGKINQAYPLIGKFNNVVAFVKNANGGFAIDAIDPMLASDMVTYQDLNGQGLLVNENGYEWVDLGVNIRESTYNNITATLEDGQLACKVITGHKGYNAANLRKTMKANGDAETANAYLKSYFTEVNVQKSSFENQNDPNASLKGAFELTSSAHVEDAGDLIYINPMLGFGLQENPFKKPERAFVVDFAYPTDDTYQFVLNIPEGYAIAEAPKSVRLATQDNSIRCDYFMENKETQIKLNYRLIRNRVIFRPEEYVDLKDFYEQIARHCADGQIVLKKL
ncbi:MAG: DUF3857 domain-containing protein [Saprospiraceae bacterium]|nr:DUF3857 domain-containing protein [Saprospiraceae bacterium]